MLVMIAKSLKTLALEKLTTKCKQNNYEDEDEELKTSDLSEYCLIATFLESCNRNNYFLCECQKWGHLSKKNVFVTFVCSIET